MRYTLLQTGPDNASTYGECWGSRPTHGGRPIAAAHTLVGLLDHVDKLDHDNWWIRGPGGRMEACSRKEYYARPVVQKAIASQSLA